MNGYELQIAGQIFNLLGSKAAIKTQLKGMYSTKDIQSATWKKLTKSEVENIWKPKPKPLSLSRKQMIQNLLATEKHTQESAEAAIEYLFNVQEGENIQYIKGLIAKDAGII